MPVLSIMLIIITLLINQIQNGRLIPDRAKAIQLSNPNAGEMTTYTFNFYPESDIIANSILFITFPHNYEKKVSFITENIYIIKTQKEIISSTNCVDPSNPSQLVLKLVLAKEYSKNQLIELQIGDIANPIKEGGTGSFQLVIKSVMGSDLTIVNQNDAYAVIGISRQPYQLLSTKVEIVATTTDSKDRAGQKSVYLITIQPQTDLPDKITFEIEFPIDYQLTYLYSNQCVNVANSQGQKLNGYFYCEVHSTNKNILIFKGNSQKISKGTEIRFQIYDIINPAREMQTDFIKIFIKDINSYFTYERDLSVQGLVIKSGKIENVKLVNYYSLQSSYDGFQREYRIDLKPTNPFNSLIIHTYFKKILSCHISKGLQQIDYKTTINCKGEYNLITVNNFKQYLRTDFASDYISIRFKAQLYSNLIQTTNPLRIFSYQTTNYVNLVDQDTNSQSSQIVIKQKPTLESSIWTYNVNEIIIQFKQTTTYSGTNKEIDIEFNEFYSGSIICYYNQDNIVYIKVDCSFNYNMVKVVLNPNYQIKTNSLLKIVGIVKPKYADTYTNILYLAQSGVVVLYMQSTQTIAVSAFSSKVIKSLIHQKSKYSLLYLDLNLQHNLESGYKVMLDPYQPYSHVLVELQNAQSSFAYNLNMVGVVDNDDLGCSYAANMADYPGLKMSCNIVFGVNTNPTTSYTGIKVQNYQTIISGSNGINIKFYIPIKYADNDAVIPTIKVNVINHYQNQPYTLYQYQGSMQQPTPVTGSTPGGSKSVVLNDYNLQSKSILTFQLRSSGTITATSQNSVLINYPPEYDMSSITVTLNGLSQTQIRVFKVISVVQIELSTQLSSGLSTLIITNVVNPSYYITNNNFEIIITSNYQTNHQYTLTLSSNLIVGTLTSTSLIADNQKYSYPDTVYTFKFGVDKQIVQGSYLELSFDPAFTQLSFIECQFVNGLVTIDTTTNILQCQYDSVNSKLKILNFKEIAINTNIEFKLLKVSNPNTNNKVITLNIKSSTTNQISTGTFITTFTNPTTFSGFTISLPNSKQNIIPNNQNLKGCLSIVTDKLSFIVPKYSEIVITVDNSYSNLYSSVTDTYVRLKGAITQIKELKFDTSNKKIIIITNEDSTINQILDIEYYGMNNNIAAGTYIYKFKVLYKTQVFISETNFNIVHTPQLISTTVGTTSLKYYPRNEAEKSEYVFKYKPQTSSILNTYYILVRFNTVFYDRVLGGVPLYIKCAQLTGALKYRLSSHDLIIYGFQTVVANTQTLEIKVYNVFNPNFAYLTNYNLKFTIGIMDSTYKILEMYQNFQTENILLAPQILNINSLKTSSVYARYEQQIDSAITIWNDKTVKKEDQLIFELPSDYLLDNFKGSCDINQKFSFYSACSFNYYNNRFYYQTTHNDYIPQNQGDIEMSFKKVFTNDNDQYTGNFIAFVYNSQLNSMLYRSYSSIQFDYLNYKYDGKQIYVNNNKAIELEVGTFCNPISITIENNEKSLQSLTLTPSVLDSNIIIEPFPVQLALGSNLVQFRIATPRESLLNTVYITWSKTGDSFPVTYAPLRRTMINIVKYTGTRVINVEAIDQLYRESQSFPFDISTLNRPYKEVIIKISFYSDHRSGLINSDGTVTLSNQYVTLSTFIDKGTYSLQIGNYPQSSLTLYYKIEGHDKDSYVFDRSSQVVPILQKETNAPNIMSITVQQTTRSSVTLQVTTDQTVFLYYAIADLHMVQPSFQNIKDKAITEYNYKFSAPSFQLIYIKKTSKTLIFTIDSLVHNHQYQIHFYVMNQNQIVNQNPKKIVFNTQRSQNSALIIMKIKQTQLDKNTKQEYIQKITQLLNINDIKIEEFIESCTVKTYSIQSNGNLIYLKIIILANPKNENADNSPYKLGLTLNQRRSEVKQFITNLDNNDFVLIEEIIQTAPYFIQQPVNSLIDIHKLSYKFSLNKCGTLYLNVIKIKNSRKTVCQCKVVPFLQKPVNHQYLTSYQIKQRLNQTNIPTYIVQSYSVTVDTPGKEFTFTAERLDEDQTIYHIYLTTEDNMYSGYNILNYDNTVVYIEGKTKRIKVPLDVFSMNPGTLLSLQLILIALLLIIM